MSLTEPKLTLPNGIDEQVRVEALNSNAANEYVVLTVTEPVIREVATITAPTVITPMSKSGKIGRLLIDHFRGLRLIFIVCQASFPVRGVGGVLGLAKSVVLRIGSVRASSTSPTGTPCFVGESDGTKQFSNFLSTCR